MKNLIPTTAIKMIIILMALLMQFSIVSAFHTGYSNRYLDTFRYGLFIPPSYDSQKSYPLVIILHGYSDTVSWDQPWYNEPIVSSDPCIVITPKCPTSYTDDWGDSWTAGYSTALGKTFKVIKLIKTQFNIDTSRIYIYGTSMGGFGVYSAISKNPDMFAAAYVTCGGGNTYFAPVFAKIPLWIFHGSADPNVSVNYARDMYHAILDAGGTCVRYTEYPGVGHNSWDYVARETTLTTWLLAQTKGSVHNTVPYPVDSFQCTLNNKNLPYLTWTASNADLSGGNQLIWYYKVYRNSQLFASVNNDRFYITDSTALAKTQYIYSVSAVNYFFKESQVSPEISITTPDLAITEIVPVTNEMVFVYPNPTTGPVTISFGVSPVQAAIVEIFNFQGALVLSKVCHNTASVTIDLSGLSKGVYLVKILIGGEIFNEKILLE